MGSDFHRAMHAANALKSLARLPQTPLLASPASIDDEVQKAAPEVDFEQIEKDRNDEFKRSMDDHVTRAHADLQKHRVEPEVQDPDLMNNHTRRYNSFQKLVRKN